VNGTVIGGDQFVVIAGPCSVESEEQILRSAEGVAKAGCQVGCAAERSSRELRRTIFKGWKKKA